MTRALGLLGRLREMEERNLIAEQDDEEVEGEETEDEDGEEDEGDGNPNPFSKENRNPDGSMKTGDKTPINDKKKKKQQ